MEFIIAEILENRKRQAVKKVFLTACPSFQNFFKVLKTV